jgi:hypothetical protein
MKHFKLIVGKTKGLELQKGCGVVATDSPISCYPHDADGCNNSIWEMGCGADGYVQDAACTSDTGTCGSTDICVSSDTGSCSGIDICTMSDEDTSCGTTDYIGCGTYDSCDIDDWC